MNTQRRAIAVSALILAACQGSEPRTTEHVQVAASAHALHGELGKMEWSIDAPWRIEPEQGGLDEICADPPCSPVLHYGAIPINVVFRDVYQDNQHRRVESVTVEEVGTGLPAQTLRFADVHEVERTVGEWHQDSSPSYDGPRHSLCRAWQGEDCSSHAWIADTSEWDALFMYDLRQPKHAGKEIRLNVSMGVWVRTQAPEGVGPPPGNGEVLKTFTNALTVRLGYPLPRFDSRWSYGDLHYHSQGTDNEGESGYSHRSTLQAMSAIGLDFAFATEHASNSGQFAGLEDFIPWVDQPLRDMSQRRWAFLLRGLHGAGGANLEVGSYARRRSEWNLAAPQLFLGGEVDVIPEISSEEQARGVIERPFRGSYSWLRACYEYPGQSVFDVCPNNSVDDLTEPARDFPGGPPVPGRFFVKDIQGPAQRLFGRQHLLHLPFSSTDEQAFVPSNTTKWGGASRRFATLLKEEYTQGRKGVTFLAHPTESASGSGPGRLGPDIMPYSISQLEDAFRNPSVLGLQVWNEDSHLSADHDDDAWHGGEVAGEYSLDPYQDQFMSTWPKYTELAGAHSHMHLGLQMADEMLRWGLDPARRLAAGVAGHRKVFISGGSDAHGDLNYSRKGFFLGLDYLTDTAMGKPRNLVFTGERQGPVLGGAVSDKKGLSEGTLAGRGLTQAQTIAGLQSGNFMVTDGPILRIGIDVNRNDVFDDGDIPMGGDTIWGRYYDALQGEDTLPILVEWMSTPEFGPVSKVDLYVGVFNNENGMNLTWAPERHGFGEWGAKESVPYRSGSREYYKMNDGYWVDPTGKLRVEVPSDEGYGGVRRIELTPNHFPAGRGVIGEDPCPNTCDPQHNPNCENIQCELEAPRYFRHAAPSSLYVRALAKTDGLSAKCIETLGQCTPRIALTNPVWAKYSPLAFDQGDDPSGDRLDMDFQLADLVTGLCLNASGVTELGGLTQSSCQKDGAHEKFALRPSKLDHQYLLESRISGQCLDVAVEGKGGAAVGLSECAHESASQLFLLQAVKEQYRVVSVASGQCLGMSSVDDADPYSKDVSGGPDGPAKLEQVSCDDEGNTPLVLFAPTEVNAVK